MVFVYTPAKADVTFTWMIQVEFAGISALSRVNESSPTSAVNDADVPQFVSEEATGLSEQRRLAMHLSATSELASPSDHCFECEWLTDLSAPPKWSLG